jgi:hypothetical protein
VSGSKWEGTGSTDPAREYWLNAVIDVVTTPKTAAILATRTR